MESVALNQKSYLEKVEETKSETFKQYLLHDPTAPRAPKFTEISSLRIIK